MNTNDLIQRAIKSVSDLLNSYQTSKIPKNKKKASLFSYWLRDYTRMLRYEETFDPKRLKTYKRGEIVKVHLGYNIGSEEGGLHYAIVLDNNNRRSDTAITIVPLTSVKNNGRPLYHARVALGDTIYLQLQEKLSSQKTTLHENLDKNNRELDILLNYIQGKADESVHIEKAELEKRIKDLYAAVDKQMKLLDSNDKISNEISKMKSGSIALVDQITTVSKIRIYDPLYHKDVLSGIRVSDEILDLIDGKIKELYLGK